SADPMLLELGDVVADVVDDSDPQFLPRALQHLLKGPPHEMGDKLPIGKGEVRGSGHCGEVLPPLFRANRSTAELGIGQVDPIFSRGPEHGFQMVAAYLVT